MSIKISRQLSLELRHSLTIGSVREWLQKVESEVGGLLWPSVGRLPNNSFFCDASSGPMTALIERVTNGMDAVFEDHMGLARLTGAAPELNSPRESARAFLGINYDLDYLGDESVKRAFREAADRLVVSLHEGSDPETPTTIVRDHGIGQHPDNFQSTLLSLGGDNKTDKPWLHGRYGGGSGATYKFAAATVITSRRDKHLLDGLGDEVGVSIVLHDTRERPGPCTYMTDKNGEILRLDLPEFEQGTEIRLVDYNLPKHHAKAAHATNSLRQAFFSHFSQPSMPFCIGEHRDRFKDRSGHQKIYGLYHALKGQLSKETTLALGLQERPPLVVHSQACKIPLGKIGGVTLRYFVLHNHAKSNYYVTPEQGFCLSLNGQRQYNRGRSWFRELGFNNIFQRIICVVECDGILYHERYSIFKSDREGILESPECELLMKKVEDVLKNDPDLQELEEEAKEEKIKNSSGKVSGKTLDEIKKIIGGEMGRGGPGNVKGRRTPPSGKKRNTDDSHLPEIPTTLKIEKNPFNAARGSRQRLYVNLDAKNGYLPHDDREITLTIPNAEVLATSGLSGGSVRFDIRIDEDAPVGEGDFIVVFKDKTNKIVLYDQGKINVTEPRQNEQTEEKKNKETGPMDREVEVHWVRKDRWEAMSEEGWGPDTVGECQETDEKITFFLNRDNVNLERASETGEFSEGEWDRFLDKYSLTVTTGLYSIRKDETEASQERVENEKRRILQAAIVSIRPELAHKIETTRRHRIPAIREPEREPTETPTETPTRRDIRNHGSFIAEMSMTGKK